MASDLFIRADDIKFCLYIEFLCDTLPLLDDMNIKLQTPNIDMYKTYCTIKSFCRAFAAPVLKDVSSAASQTENHVDISDVIFHGSSFNSLLFEYLTSSDLTEDELETIRVNCVKFMLHNHPRTR